ncbi:MAG: acyl carrier protein [Candidatus Hydrogenedentota bacterium]
MNSDAAISIIHNIFIEGFDVEPDALVGTAQLGDDLGLDSLDGLDLVVALEKEFGLQIPEEKARSMSVLQDIYDYVEEKSN